MAVSEELLKAAKDYLCISWDSETGNENLRGLLSRGMAYLDQAVGVELDYKIEDIQRQLLFDFCRYGRSDAFEEFKVNFLSEILSLQIREDIKAYEKPKNTNLQ